MFSPDPKPKRTSPPLRSFPVRSLVAAKRKVTNPDITRGRARSLRKISSTKWNRHPWPKMKFLPITQLTKDLSLYLKSPASQQWKDYKRMFHRGICSLLMVLYLVAECRHVAFWGRTTLFFTVCILIYIPSSRTLGFPFLPIPHLFPSLVLSVHVVWFVIFLISGKAHLISMFIYPLLVFGETPT